MPLKTVNALLDHFDPPVAGPLKEKPKMADRSRKWISPCLSVRKPNENPLNFRKVITSIKPFVIPQSYRNNLEKMACARKAKTQQFSRRKPSLMRKADQLARLYHADVALVIRRNGRYYTYRSIDNDRWPPTIEEIVYINPISRTKVDLSVENIVPIAYQPPV